MHQSLLLVLIRAYGDSPMVVLIWDKSRANFCAAARQKGAAGTGVLENQGWNANITQARQPGKRELTA
jgi:hypothetical protein